ncbi:MAG: hypothetical protein HY726_01125 [Candidatus Rokubacteria bacterium]|nr:hypothetical protein [Candidatus Rokubacteria bacterium]
MRTVTVNLIGVAVPGLPRQMVLSLDEGATIRALLELQDGALAVSR